MTIKALQNKTFTDNVAMNIALKDSARDKLMPTLKPYMLAGHPTYASRMANTIPHYISRTARATT